MHPAPRAGDTTLDALLEPLRADPARAAVLTDLDGALAPIVARPELAAVPARAREALARLSERYALVGCVSGRRAAEARRLVGVEGIAYAGNHGLELLAPGEEEPRLDPALERPRATTEGEASVAGPANAASFVEGLDDGALAAAGIRVEDKGPIQALHWRGAGDEPGAEAKTGKETAAAAGAREVAAKARAQEIAAEALAREIAAAAERAGLHPHWGRKVLELRPLAAVGKDVAVRALLSASGAGASSHAGTARSPFRPHSGHKCERAVYGGDDRTDLDAFRGLRELREAGELETAICVGIVSPEAPPELAERSDLTVDGPAGWLAVLQSLAE